MSVLVVAEKESVARDIAKAMNVPTRCNGYYKKDNMIVSWCSGHLVMLALPEHYDAGYAKWRTADLPLLPSPFQLRVIPESSRQYSVLQQLMESPEVSEIVCATDNEREGQLIFQWVYTSVGCTKPVKRLWIDSMTEKKIRDGFNNLRDNAEFEGLFLSAQARAQADWLVGINGTRALSVLNNAKVTIGRVQTPTLAMIVERQHSIDSFIATPYWYVSADFKGDTLYYIDQDKSPKITDPGLARAIAARAAGKTGTVISYNTVPKQEERPQLYSTSAILQDANAKYGFAAKHTADILQSLYERHKITTYPRVDTSFITDAIAQTMPELVTGIADQYRTDEPEIARISDALLKRGLSLDSRVVDDTQVEAHPAIIVTEEAATYDLSKLTEDEDKIFRLITARMLEAMSTAFKFSETEVTVAVENDRYFAKGKTVIKEGWKYIERIFASKYGTAKKQADTILNLKDGDSAPAVNIQIHDKETTPPKPHTDGTLLRAMENVGRQMGAEERAFMSKGLGRPSSNPDIIEKLIDTQYIVRNKKALVPTEKGKSLIMVVPPKLKTPSLTAEWEKQLENINRRTTEPEPFIEGIRQYITEVTDEILQHPQAYKFVFAERRAVEQEKIVGKCPRCGRGVIEGKNAFNCTGYYDSPKCEFAIWRENNFLISQGKAGLTRTMVKQLLANGKTVAKGLKSPKTGNQYDVMLVLEDNGKGFANVIPSFGEIK